ncbi:YifB family Mg chelatase-like AAA ATPase [Dietzia alimentaria]|uniref:YifB family Mg chelatase-like AAA ATPase n=1 Tax=Dietzia alimentaria TaxID=665550 RepID=UPI00029A0677|nr:YifB family Mg chelatase-like AAA ATPase [Dietzia alimentaria]
MALGRTWAVTLSGVGGQLVEVEADVGRGLPGVSIVGLPDSAVLQARERMRAAVINSGLTWPGRKVVLSLSPAAIPKRGSGFDLPLAVGTLAASGELPGPGFDETLLVGELALDGRVRPVRGVLPAVLAAREAGLVRAIVPAENLAEARLVRGIDTAGVDSLAMLAAWSRGSGNLVAHAPPPREAKERDLSDLAEVHGQEDCRRAVEVAAAGGHALLLRGAPGTGKTMLARRLPGLLPDLAESEALETTAILSVLGRLSPEDPLLRRPPLVAPHHSASMASLVGGGSTVAHPGAATLAHRGVLFLDECAEFPSRVLDSLRTPLEDGEVRIARGGRIWVFPARFQLVLAANDCPCGSARPDDCACTPNARRRYGKSLTGPLRDRIDIAARTLPMGSGILSSGEVEDTALVRARVSTARSAAVERWAACPDAAGARSNADVPGRVLRTGLGPGSSGSRLLDRALAHGVLSPRGVDRCLRLAWTLADLEGACVPSEAHVSEALVLRGED